MNTLSRLFAAALCALPLATQAAAPVIDNYGLGALRIGMPLDDLPGPLEQPINRRMYYASGECFYVFPSHGPKLALMIEGDRLTRIEVLARGPRTARGITVGDSVSQLKRAYGAAAVEAPNFHDSEVPEFTVTSPDGRRALRFSTHQGRVSAIYVGRARSVAYVEGCL